MDSAKRTLLLQQKAHNELIYDRQTTPTLASGPFEHYCFARLFTCKQTEGSLNQQYIKSRTLSPSTSLAHPVWTWKGRDSIVDYFGKYMHM